MLTNISASGILLIGTGKQANKGMVDNMKVKEKCLMEDKYYLYENEKEVAHSYKFEYVLNKTTNTKNGMIYYNGILVWVQNIMEVIK